MAGRVRLAAQPCQFNAASGTIIIMNERHPIFAQLEASGLANMSGLGMRRRLGKVRLEWRDGSTRDLTRIEALILAGFFEDCGTAALAGQPCARATVHGLAVILVPEGDYHGEKTPLVRLDWDGDSYLDIHPKAIAEYAAAIRQFAKPD